MFLQRIFRTSATEVPVEALCTGGPADKRDRVSQMEEYTSTPQARGSADICVFWRIHFWHFQKERQGVLPVSNKPQ